MRRRPPRSTRTDTLCPYTTLFRSALVAPLVRAGLLPADWPYICHAVSGYSGGGKALIERFEQDGDIEWRGYALALGHKHVPEMQARCGLSDAHLFSLACIPANRGLLVGVPWLLRRTEERPVVGDGCR